MALPPEQGQQPSGAAFKTVELAFRQENIIVGKDVEVTPLKRTTPSEMYILE